MTILVFAKRPEALGVIDGFGIRRKAEFRKLELRYAMGCHDNRIPAHFVLLKTTNRKSYTSFRLVPLLMTLKYIWTSFQPRSSFPRPFQQSLACFCVTRSPSNSWASCYLSHVKKICNVAKWQGLCTVLTVRPDVRLAAEFCVVEYLWRWPPNWKPSTSWTSVFVVQYKPADNEAFSSNHQKAPNESYVLN